MTRGTSTMNSFFDEVGRVETNRAIPEESVVPLCAALAAPRQWILT